MDSCRHSALSVQQQAKDALSLARLAVKRYEEGSGLVAARLQAAAERSHSLILAAIRDLTDGDADLAEPTITDLEGELYRLAQWACGLMNRN